MDNASNCDTAVTELAKLISSFRGTLIIKTTSFPANTSPYDTIPDDKIVLVIGPIAFTKQQAFIEALTLIPIPGDPADPKYEETVPDLPYPYFMGMGHVVGNDATSPTESSSCIYINVSDYVKDQYMASSVRYAL